MTTQTAFQPNAFQNDAFQIAIVLGPALFLLSFVTEAQAFVDPIVAGYRQSGLYGAVVYMTTFVYDNANNEPLPGYWISVLLQLNGAVPSDLYNHPNLQLAINMSKLTLTDSRRAVIVTTLSDATLNSLYVLQPSNAVATIPFGLVGPP